MLELNFTFTPFDMTPLWEMTIQQFKWGWFDKDHLKQQVDIGLLPAEYYEKATSEKYEKDKKKA